MTTPPFKARPGRAVIGPVRLLVLLLLVTGLVSVQAGAADPPRTNGADLVSTRGAAAPTISKVWPNSGPPRGGQRVTMTGTGFVGVKRVLFGSVAGSAVKVISPSVLEVTSPAHPGGLVNIKVVTSGGTSAAGSAPRYTYLAGPTVTAISPSSGPAEGGSSVSVTGKRFVGVTAVLFGSKPAARFTVSSSSMLTAIAPSGGGTVDLRVRTASGLSPILTAARFTYVGEGPKATSVTPASGPAAGGTLVSIVGSGFIDAHAVTIGGAMAEFTIISANRIDATTPPGNPGQAPITVSTPSGTSSPLTFTYDVVGPVITALAPSSGPISGGTSVTIRGSGLASVQQVHFGAEPAASITAVDDTSLVAVAPAGAQGAVPVTVTTSVGTSTPSPTATFVYITESAAVAQVAAGSDHACALDVAGTVRCWGWNGFGQLGDGTTHSRTAPVAVTGLPIVTQLAAGGGSTCALTIDASLWCWGWNTFGQLGDGTTIDRSVPTKVAALDQVQQVTLGNGHGCALLAGDRPVCWGWNHYGQLGSGTTTSSPLPVAVVDAPAGIAQLSAGDEHSCARTAAGGLWCWGANHTGQLGDATTSPSARPTPVSGMSAGVEEVSAGLLHTCAIRDGAALCWGRNVAGQVGDGTMTRRLLPTVVAGMESGVVALSAGGASCALRSGGWCWGPNIFRGPGEGSDATSLLPAPVIGLPPDALDIRVGRDFACARTASGAAYCWGDNAQGQLGDGSTASRGSAAPILGLP